MSARNLGQILDLCGGTGEWSRPYRDAGYMTLVVDPQAVDLPHGQTYRGTVAEFLAELRRERTPPRFRGVLAAPPCTEFAGSGARWWADKPPQLLADALAVVDDCLDIIERVEPAWWALENPVGRLRTLRAQTLGAPALIFNPCDYAGWLQDPSAEAYTKRTLLWGRFTQPERRQVEPQGVRPGQPNAWYSRVGGKSAATKRYRSQTPRGFALAFHAANK